MFVHACVCMCIVLLCEVDTTQVEINPLGETPCGKVVCFDAKINFDDNSEFRQAVYIYIYIYIQ